MGLGLETLGCFRRRRVSMGYHRRGRHEDFRDSSDSIFHNLLQMGSTCSALYPKLSSSEHISTSTFTHHVLINQHCHVMLNPKPTLELAAKSLSSTLSSKPSSVDRTTPNSYILNPSTPYPQPKTLNPTQTPKPQTINPKP